MTTFTHAHIDEDGNVLSLRTGSDGVEGGAVVVELGQAVAHWPAAPSAHVTLRCTPEGELQWHDTRTLAEAKAAKNAEINAARLAANETSFVFGGKAIACDRLSRGDIDGVHGQVVLTGQFPTGWPGAWKAVDNTYVTIATPADWGAFYGAMVQQGMANFAKAQALKAQLAAASTLAEVDAITWD